MFLLTRPARREIDRFLDRSRGLPVSYGPVGIVREARVGQRFDEQVATIGRGDKDFDLARRALERWAQFEVGWVTAFPARHAIEPGTDVAVLIRHLGFWSLNGARVLYTIDEPARFGYAYGTLTNHAESGEELFEVTLDPHTGDVNYRIRARSWPQRPLAWLGQPIVRLLQARFREDSARAMAHAMAASVR